MRSARCSMPRPKLLWRTRSAAAPVVRSIQLMPGEKAEPRNGKYKKWGPRMSKRCEKIAELLVEGKKDEELDTTIQEFDHTHVPQVVTQFEAQLTALCISRSSSAPVPDAEDKKAFLQSSSLSSSSPCLQRIHRASTQPAMQCLPLSSLHRWSSAPRISTRPH